MECPINALCRFSIPVTEPDGQPASFRLSGSSQAGGITQPPGASIDAGSGLYSWDTTGATLNAGGETLYSTQVTIEDLDSSGDLVSKSAIDFFIRLARVVATPADALISIPVRWCGVQGAPSMANPNLVGESSTKDVLWRRHERTSDNTYIRQADVTFRSAATRALPDFPIIPDRAGPGGAGDVFADPNTNNYNEVLQLVNDCRTVWKASAPKVTGLIAIHMGRFVDSGGNPTDLLGLGLDIQDRFPVWKAGGWAMVIDNARIC